MIMARCSILSPLNVLNRFKLEQHWNLLEIYFQNKGKCRTKFGHREGPTVPSIHSPIIGHYNPLVRITNQVFKPLMFCTLIFICEWQDLQFQNFCEKSAERKSQKKYFLFSYFVLMSTWDTNPGFASNKPTQYLLDYSVYTLSDIRKFITEILETGFIVDSTRHERVHTVRTPENIEAVCVYIEFCKKNLVFTSLDGSTCKCTMKSILLKKKKETTFRIKIMNLIGTAISKTADVTITINGNTYHSMITKFFVSAPPGIDVKEFWF